MSWPSDDLTVNHLDQATDDPSQARTELLAAVNKVKAILATLPPGVLPLVRSGGANSRLDGGAPLEFGAPQQSILNPTASVLQMLATASAGEVVAAGSDAFYGAGNALKNSAGQWVRIDTGKPASLVGAHHSGPVVYVAPAGANPIVWQGPFRIQRSFSGRIAANGSVVKLPAGWTVSKGSAGAYRITHGLNTADYTVVATCRPYQGFRVPHVSEGFTPYMHFDVNIFVSPGNLADSDFGFTLTLDD